MRMTRMALVEVDIMRICGNCEKPVADGDIICPHCDVLLAAYESPDGSSADIASILEVDMHVPEPEETSDWIDSEELNEVPFSTAPRPLFDTQITLESVKEAAESERVESVVTITDPTTVDTKKMKFESPDYARPPTNAAPIPIVEDADDGMPVIVAEDTTSAPARKESWLLSNPPPQTEQIPARPRPVKQRPPRQPRAPQGREEVGQTDAYLRELRAKTGQEPAGKPLSRPVETRQRRTPNNVVKPRAKRPKYVWPVGIILWLLVIFSLLIGKPNFFLIIIAIGFSWMNSSMAQR